MAGTPVQESLVDVDAGRPAERIVMSLNPEYYELIWAGLKRHEFRRRFVAGQPVEWYVYLTAPVSRLAAVIELEAAVVDTPEVIAAIAEEARPGNGASVLAYVQDLPRAFAMPIRRVSEYAGLDAAAVKAELGTFHPPQGYIRVAHTRSGYGCANGSPRPGSSGRCPWDTRPSAVTGDVCRAAGGSGW